MSKRHIELVNGVSYVEETVDPSTLKRARFNPPSRTGEYATAGLKKEVEAVGRVLVPLAIYEDGTIIDGHRRQKVALDLGLPGVRVNRYFGPRDQVMALFVPLNTTQKKFTKGQQMLAMYEGSPSFGGTVANAFTELQHLLSAGDFEQFVQEERTPFMLQLAKKAVKYMIAKKVIELQPDSAEHRSLLRKAVLWMMRNEVQEECRRHIKYDYNARALYRAIVENLPSIPARGQRLQKSA